MWIRFAQKSMVRENIEAHRKYGEQVSVWVLANQRLHIRVSKGGSISAQFVGAPHTYEDFVGVAHLILPNKICIPWWLYSPWLSLIPLGWPYLKICDTHHSWERLLSISPVYISGHTPLIVGHAPNISLIITDRLVVSNTLIFPNDFGGYFGMVGWLTSMSFRRMLQPPVIGYCWLSHLTLVVFTINC